MFRKGPRTPSSTASGRRPTSRYSNNNSRYESASATPSSKRGPPAAQRGLFADGAWLCDCAPRLPAEHFRVKKEGKNHGRWFYTCQNSEGKRCGFFLWDEDAKIREEKAVLAGKRTEPGREDDEAGGVSAETNALPRSDEANPAWLKTRTEGEVNWRKRGAEVVAKVVDSDTETEDDLNDIMSWPPSARGEEPETPSKRQKTEEYATPMTTTTKRKLPWLDYGTEEAEDPQGSKGVSHGLPTPSLTKPIDPHDPSTSPTTGRFRDAMRCPPPRELTSTTSTKTLSEEVLGVLESSQVSLGDKARDDLLAALNRHEMKLQGVVKGRELVRAALKGKEARIAELQGRIAGVEAEREVLRGALNRLKGPEA